MATWQLPQEHLTTRRLDGSAFVHVEGAQAVAVLNGTALSVWDLAPLSCDLDDLVRRVAEANGVAGDDVRADVARTLEELLAAGLLVHG